MLQKVHIQSSHFNKQVIGICSCNLSSFKKTVKTILSLYLFSWKSRKTKSYSRFLLLKLQGKYISRSHTTKDSFKSLITRSSPLGLDSLVFPYPRNISELPHYYYWISFIYVFEFHYTKTREVRNFGIFPSSWVHMKLVIKPFLSAFGEL